MHTFYISLKTWISDLEHKLITIHAKFNEVHQIVYEPKQANNKDVRISYLGTEIIDPNYLTLMILSSSTLELTMWPIHHGWTTKQKLCTCPNPPPSK